MALMTAIQVDARNLLCPLPVIRCQDRVRQMKPGEQLEIVCTDPGATNDIPAWCRINGHSVIRIWREEREIHLLVQVG